MVISKTDRKVSNRRIDRRLMSSEVESRTKLKRHRPFSFRDAIPNEGCVLAMGKVDALFDGYAPDFVSPERHTGIQRKQGQVRGAAELACLGLKSIQVKLIAIRKHHSFQQIVQHHGPALWGRKSGHQIAVKYSCRRTAQGSRGIAAQAICDQP